MADAMVIEAVRARLRAGLKTRILAFGSSNTERFIPGAHWLDVFDVLVKQSYGRIHHCISTGIGGHTSSQLLERFAEDAAFYQPHLVFLTVGGNDSNPPRNLSPETFRANLLELHARFARLGTAVVFQTYYAPIAAQVSPEHAPRFAAYMQLIRDVAAETHAGLVDHLVRWEALQRAHLEQYRPLMQDAFHLNRHGNQLFGLDLGRVFGARPNEVDPDYWRPALDLQATMDRLLPPG
jgi:lysophospholipase L1-like esterase